MAASGPVVVLLIDDDEDDREFFQIAVLDTGINILCESAKGATEGLAMLDARTISPDFIFLDLNMPGINGLACLQQLKSNPGTASIPVIIFSTSSEQQDIVDSKKAGAMHFMTKPADLSQLSRDLTIFFTQHFQNKDTHEK